MKILPIFYDPRCNFKGDTGSVSPSPSKPGLVMGAIGHSKACRYVSLPVFNPASLEHLCLAHSEFYVDDVLLGSLPNGFGNFDHNLNRVQCWTTAAMMDAAKHAVFNQTITCAPVSGFHHAGWASAHGFCTFNGLVIAALLSGAKKVGVIDCGYHHGDGTENIIEVCDYGDTIMHWSAGELFHEPRQANQMLQTLPTVVREMAEAGCELIIYQAGGDQHVDDPLGGLLTTEQMRIRDKLVFTWAYNICGLPVTFNFAGGYQEPVSKVVDLHLQTLEVASQCLNDQQGELSC